MKFKFEINNDTWSFKSPSGTPWTYPFTLEKPVVIKITHSQMKDVIGHNGFQSQTKLKIEKILPLIYMLQRYKFRG